MPDSILTDRCRARIASLTAADQLAVTRATLTPDQHIQIVERLLQDHRQNAERRMHPRAVTTDRRGFNPQRNGWEDQSDVATAFAADSLAQKD
jgi:hypothetical protein